MTAPAQRRLLIGLLLVTVALVLLDLAGSPLPSRVRAVAAAATGPAQRLLAEVPPSEAVHLREENATLRVQLQRSQAALAESAAVDRLLSAPPTSGRQVVAARVVGSRTTATGGRMVTLDVGQRDGVDANLSVVTGQGLVGRVVSVGPWSCDVRVLGGADATVGVRVGQGGALGSVSTTPPAGAPALPSGQLALTVVDQGSVAVGDKVTTLGSVQERPYPAGIDVGTVVSVDPPRGQLTPSAVVRPAVDVARLSVVAVLLAPPGDQPRPAAGR